MSCKEYVIIPLGVKVVVQKIDVYKCRLNTESYASRQYTPRIAKRSSACVSIRTHTHSFACASVHYVHTDPQTNNLMYLEQVWETGNESWTTGMRMGSPGGLAWL